MKRDTPTHNAPIIKETNNKRLRKQLNDTKFTSSLIYLLGTFIYINLYFTIFTNLLDLIARICVRVDLRTQYDVRMILFLF